MITDILTDNVPALLLYILLAIAVVSDCNTRKIPNKIVFTGSVLGVLLHSAISPGSGFFSLPFGGLGFTQSISGFGVGLGLMLPMYILKAMGAGDVKLMAMIGAFFGPIPIVNIVLFTLLAGGVLSIIAAIVNKNLKQVILNTQYMLTHSIIKNLSGGASYIEQPPAPTGKLPYACAIAVGVIAHLATTSLGYEAL
jgi:prepilin peptidase CpaA